MTTVLELLKQRLAGLEEMGRGDGPLAKQLRAQIEASEAFPNSSAEQLYRVIPIQMSKDKTQDEMEDEEPLRDDDPNRPETEEDAIRAEAIRRLRVLHLAKGRPDQTKK